MFSVKIWEYTRMTMNGKIGYKHVEEILTTKNVVIAILKKWIINCNINRAIVAL